MDQNEKQFDTVAGGASSIAEEARKKLRWALLSLVLAALTIHAVSAQWKDFSFAAFLEDLQQADWRWMVPAVLCMLGFIVFEALAIRSACQVLNHPTRLFAACGFAAADIYFSAITPSASGGQPACALLMRRQGIPLMVSAAVLLLTLAMYAMAILTIGLVCVLCWGNVFAVFGGASKTLIVIGFAAQCFLAVTFFLMLWREKLLEKIAVALFELLARLRLIRHVERRRTRLREMMEEYRVCTALLSGHRGLLLRSYFFNLLQRTSQILVTVCCFLALGGRGRLAGDIFAMQSFAVIGSNCVPVPGAMGVVDYLMLDGFEAFLPSDLVVSMELLSRSLSFYICVLLCALIVFVTAFRKRKGSRP